MNRQQRRTLERQGNKVNKPLLVHQDTIQKYVEEHIEEIQNTTKAETIKSMLQVFALALNNEFEFGKERINKAIRRTVYQYECMTAGTLTQLDINDFLKEKGLKNLI